MRTVRRAAMALPAVAMLLLAISPAAARAATWPSRRVASAPTFTAIGPLDSNVLSMSADGSILVGDDIYGRNAFEWTPARGTRFLGAAGGQVSVSRDGSTIVGDVFSHGHVTAAIYRSGTWRSLGGYPGSEGCPALSNAYAVADGGSSVVGLGWNDCDATAFEWTRASGIQSLGSLDDQASRANDVNADGSVIVGWDDATDGARRGARWVDGAESLLSPTGPFVGSAEAVTADGSVVVGGEAGPGAVHNQAYRWTQARGPQLLGKLPGGGVLAIASALSVTDDGKIVVGFSGAALRKAFLWAGATGMIPLQSYLQGLGVTGLDGWHLDTAISISADGSTIAGWGYNPDGRVQSWLVTGLPAIQGRPTVE